MADLQTMLLQIRVDPGQHRLAQLVVFEQMAELAHRGLVRRRLPAQVDACEAAHGERVVERIFDARVGEVEPLLQKIDAQHPLHAHRRSSVAGLGIMRLDQRHQLRPRDHQLHRGKKLRTTRLSAVPLETRPHRKCLLLHPHNLKDKVI